MIRLNIILFNDIGYLLESYLQILESRFLRVLYVNAQIKDDTALGQLMHDFSCTSAEEMHYQILADRVRYFKEDTEGVATMCKAMEDMRKNAAKENSIETARMLLALGKLSYEEIAQSVRLLNVDEVKALDEGRSA